MPWPRSRRGRFSVNYYEHHLGDYAEATAHLSFVEDAAYSRCIRKYYATEQPLPTDLRQVQRLVGARSEEERKAVEIVLHEFFELRDDGWHQNRCDEEIARYQVKRAGAQASANARWKKTTAHSERNANAMRTHGVSDANAMRAQCEGNALQSPDSSHQTPEEKNIRSSLSASDDSNEGREGKPEEGQLSPEAALAIPLRKQGVKVTAMHPLLVAWVKDGFTKDQALSAVAVARSSLGDDAPIAAKYLDTIIRNPPTPGATRTPAQPQAPRTHDDRERESLQKLKDRRQAIGLDGFRDPKPNESASDYRNAQDEEWNKRKRAPVPSLADLQSRGSA
jgi:uncharacterized protein YdaU (DUF1376 family)